MAVLIPGKTQHGWLAVCASNRFIDHDVIEMWWYIFDQSHYRQLVTIHLKYAAMQLLPITLREMDPGIKLQERHCGRDGISNHQPHDCLLNRLIRHRSKKTSKLRVTGLCAGKSPVTGEFPAQMASKAGNGSICRRHHDLITWVRRDAVLANKISSNWSRCKYKWSRFNYNCIAMQS